MRLPWPVVATPLALMLALAGCSTVQKNAGACPAVPPPQNEVRPKPPVSEHQQIWQPGHWDWNGNSYSWRHGEWILQRTAPSNQWLPGSWQRDEVPGPCRWVPAHWL